MCIKYSTLVKTNFNVKVDCEDVFLLWWQCEGNSDVLRKKPHIAWQQYNLQCFRPICMFITLGYRTSCKTKGVDCENVKVHHFLVPLTTVPVCADTSWWRRQALTCGYSYTDSLCRNMDETQQFSAVWESGSVPSSVEVNCCLSTADGSPVSLPNLSCNHSDAQFVLQVLTFFWQVIRNQAPTDS